jgi:serine/threonine-protein kinase
MAADDSYERALQSLLDGASPLACDDEGDEDPRLGPLLAIDAISRTFRRAIFGRDIAPDRAAADLWGHLEIRSEVGRGASGTVYRAWDTRLQREVALKLLPPEAAAGNALLEGRMLARLNHPHIVRIFGADRHDDVDGIWMELLEGDTLEHVLERDGPFGLEDALLIGLALSRALAAVHTAGLLHRDIKARNVMRERGGRIVLMDFSAGRAAGAAASADGMGTPMYMAPEILSGGAATESSDLYSLGILLYRLLTCAFPVTASDLDGLRSAQSSAARTPLSVLRPDLPADSAAVVERACHPDIAMRFATAADMEAALDQAFHHAIASRASVRSAAWRAWIHWRRAVVAALALLATATLAIAAAWDTGQGRAVRRWAGWRVPPLSPLYLTFNGGVGILRDDRIAFFAGNPATASLLAVSPDQGVVTMSGMPPWGQTARFRLDGTRVAALPAVGAEVCCFADGTTDGTFNYAVRADSTLLEPIGSRPLAPPALYRFDRDWSNPELRFPLNPEGTYRAVAYSEGSKTVWLGRMVEGTSFIEQWTLGGSPVGVPFRVPGVVIALGVDPVDHTLWALKEDSVSPTMRLENFGTSGRHLGSFDFEKPQLLWLAAGLEFEWRPSR